MSGIYIHIPFCKKACHYCDFHFSTSLKHMDEMVEAICKELALKSTYLPDSLQSVYFGGGTPSLLKEAQLQQIFDALYKHYRIEAGAEITLESNPDDLSLAEIKRLKASPINRISIGTQSFFDEDLLWMNRAHNAHEALSSIQQLQDHGFDNLSIDLIYGYHLLSDEKWQYNLQQAADLNIPHISAYALTVEARTALAYAINKKLSPPIDDKHAAKQFSTMVDFLNSQGFEQYEISNFAKNKQYARHNTNYWRGVPYLGIGPSAHGFDGQARYANLADNHKYIKALQQGKLAQSKELLSKEDRYNEYIMTSLRTMWGIDAAKIEQEFGTAWSLKLQQGIAPYLKQNLVEYIAGHYCLNAKGKLFADRIAADLFQIND